MSLNRSVDDLPYVFPHGGPYLISSLDPLATNAGYVLSPNFYAGDKAAMTPFEFLVYAVIHDRKLVDIKEFIDGYLAQYTQLTFEEQFYFIPLYLWLIDVALDSIPEANAFMS